MTSEKSLARIAGCLYLIVAVLGGFAELSVRSSIVAPGDAAATAENIRASATLFRLGFVSDLVQATCFLLTAMALYLLLKHVNTLVASAMVTFVAVSVAIMCLNLLNQFVALSIATGEGYASVFGSVGSDTLAMLFVDMHHDGYLIAQIFFGLWLLPLGYLVVKSGYFPRALGVVLMVGCFGYLSDLFAHFLAPAVAEGLTPFVLAPAVVGELWLVAWLLVKAVRAPERETRVSPSPRLTIGCLVPHFARPCRRADDAGADRWIPFGHDVGWESVATSLGAGRRSR